MNDEPTSFEVVDDAMVEVLRTKTESERLEIAFGMWRFARDTIRQTVAAEHPDWDEDKIRCEVATRMSHGAV